ncbi:hypothetical protein N9C10_01565 [Flavobacteriaceae bacterium]|nr:hypothetical protein [Flavobacteriaceae bacterium]
MIIVGIDIGYHNLGLIKASVNDEYEPEVNFAKRIDITNIRCSLGCKIPHTNEVADLVAHFVEAYRDILYTADIILIERQPPGGLTNVETLIVYIFRDKIKLISPNSMHKHFMIGHFDYELRKKKTEEIAGSYLEHLDSYTNQVRKHDMSDAMCLILYHTAEDRRKHKLRKNKKNTVVKNFEEFAYVGKK